MGKCVTMTMVMMMLTVARKSNKCPPCRAWGGKRPCRSRGGLPKASLTGAAWRRGPHAARP
eukprot:1687130-Pyramimonas_sp.AAC.1